VSFIERIINRRKSRKEIKMSQTARIAKYGSPELKQAEV